MEVLLEVESSLSKGVLDGQLLWIILRELLVDTCEKLLSNSLNNWEERSILSNGCDHDSHGLNSSSSESHLAWGLRLDIIDDLLHQWHELVEVVSELFLNKSSGGIEKIHNLLLHWLVLFVDSLGQVVNQALE